MPRKTRMTVPVSKRALVQRMNRRLAKDDQRLRKCRADTSAWNNLGDWYVLDTYRNTVVDTHVNIEQLARELGVLGAGEHVESE